MVQRFEIYVFSRDDIDVHFQLFQLVIGRSARVRVSKGFNFQPGRWVHGEISAQIVEHDGIAGIVPSLLAPRLRPNPSERFALENASFFSLDGNRRSRIT